MFRISVVFLYNAHPHLCILEEEHDGVHRVVPDSQTGQEDPVQVELEDGDGDVHKQLVGTRLGGDVRVDGSNVRLHVISLGEQVSGVLHLYMHARGR